jgi:hypothetical protein
MIPQPPDLWFAMKYSLSIITSTKNAPNLRRMSGFFEVGGYLFGEMCGKHAISTQIKADT